MTERYIALGVFMAVMAVVAAVGFYFAARERREDEARRRTGK